VRPLLGSSPQEEAAKQERLIASLANANRARIAAEINRTMQAMADQYEIGRGLPQLPDGSEARLTATMQAVVGQAIATFGARILDRGKAATLTLDQKGFAEFFARLAAEFIAAEMIRRRITAINETTRDHVMRMIASGQENGDSLDKIAKAIRERAPRIARVRAHVIARTETHNAANYGAHHAAKATGLQLVKEWVSVEDHRTRDFLEPTISEFSHRAMNGVQVAMDAPFMVPGLFGKTESMMYPGDPAGSPGNTINCFVPDTTVAGRFEAASRVLYVGDVVKIETRGGRNLTVTPNHPVMTGDGLVHANKISKGDNLVAYVAKNENPFGIIDQNIDLRPSRIDDVFAALSQVNKPVFARVGSIDFHGDGSSAQGNVEIVAAKGELIIGCDAALGQFLDYFALVHSNAGLAGEVSSSAQPLFAGANSPTTCGSVGRGDLMLSSGLRHAGPFDGFRLASVSLATARPGDSAHDGVAGASEMLGNAFDAFAAGMAVFDDVVSIRREKFCGHVYDLQERSSLMIAEGVIVSNCRCASVHSVLE